MLGKRGIVMAADTRRLTYAVCAFCSKAHSGFHPTHHALYCKTCKRDLAQTDSVAVFKLSLRVATSGRSDVLDSILLFDNDVATLLGCSASVWEAAVADVPEIVTALERELIGAHILYSPKPSTRKQSHPDLLPDTLVSSFTVLSPADRVGHYFERVLGGVDEASESQAVTDVAGRGGRYRRMGFVYADADADDGG
ncbi:uncharacterized protein AMSG_04601 [Thecamonas trahens ATCC 50062]|uniref:Replication factor A C-terminal domain-containing protein n=1 Tax=Thecamonas trahens ATCC 50062 TaxID=461836 RepID=A0A0L0D9U1_THETB|nr:hypothetical protein AMSG_04601 [Thecamonas trahens ATCC 50062]KNC48856.1 hypothetical protein AMSG_04601 [Thecamonas trahens ATCC 50062]|eukprot:XP_013758276.1 hypothetical protein AMSG_04601 [Thecamonas trahens ATCC 50062]